MRNAGWTPSIVPKDDDHSVYIVLDDFGRNGRAYRETDVERADLEAVIMDMLEGQYENPLDQDRHGRVRPALSEWIRYAKAATLRAQGTSQEADCQYRNPIQRELRGR